MENVEIKYIDIVWNDERTVLKVDESDQPIELEKSDNCWQGDTIAYPEKYFRVGLCVTGELLYEPYLKLPNNRSFPLRPVKVPGKNKTWWIEQGAWDNKLNAYLSSIYRTAGHVDVSVQGQTIRLHNHTVNFSVEDLEYYLSDLKGKLWMLMLDDQSASKANIRKETNLGISLGALKLFGDLANSFEALIKKPHVTLSETQEKLPKKLVKPVTKTFREIVTQSTQKLLTSRSFRESFNTAENRFTHYMAYRTLYRLKALGRLANHQLLMMRERAEKDIEWLENESQRKTKIVDSEVFDNEIKAISLELENQQKALDETAECSLITNNGKKFLSESFTVVLTSKYKDYDTKYFVQLLNGYDFKKRHETYLVFSSGIDFSEIYSTDQLGRYEFKVTGSGIKSKESNKSGRYYFEMHFTHVESVVCTNSPSIKELERLRIVREKLVNNNWVANISHKEFSEICNQKEITERRLSAIQLSLNEWVQIESQLPSLITRIKRIVNFFKKNKVGQQHTIPNSMVFVRNPLYSVTKALYRKVLTLNGIDDSVLNSLMAIDEIGLINLPDLYERWCLLQIIFVIRDIYQFRAELGWQEKLIDAVLSKRKNIEIGFISEERQISMKLTFEKELSSGRRPDYVIDLFYFKKPDDSGSSPFPANTFGSSIWPQKYNQPRRFVLDAKFRGSVDESHINRLIEQLYYDKDYSEGDSNSVFIIHPVSDVTNDRTSPLEWGRFCNYGQTEEANHKKGAIYLSPIRARSDTIDNLQRLIGMFLQQFTVVLDDGTRNRIVWHNKCCVACGGQDLTITLKSTQRGNNVNIIYCNSCGQNTIETVCVSCKRSLYKNGIKWTYHRTRAEQTTNVVCPKCETFL